MRNLKLFFFPCALALAGCISVPPEEADASVRIGNAPSSVIDVKAARADIRVYSTAPAGAQELGRVKAIRCHRYPSEPKPSKETVLDDLRVAALGLDASGITDVTIERQPGNVGYNCWFRYFGRATAIKGP